MKHRRKHLFKQPWEDWGIDSSESDSELEPSSPFAYKAIQRSRLNSFWASKTKTFKIEVIWSYIVVGLGLGHIHQALMQIENWPDSVCLFFNGRPMKLKRHKVGTMQDPNRLTGMAGMASPHVSQRTHSSNWEQNWKFQVEPATAKHDCFPCVYVYQSYIIQDMCHNNLSVYCAETHSSSSLWFIQLPSSDLLQWHRSCEADVLSWHFSLDLALTSAGLRFCRWATDVGAPR